MEGALIRLCPMPDATRSRFVCFGVFRLDFAAGELYDQDRRIRLQEQPFKLLQMLIDQPGQLLTRDSIRQKLWPNGTVVEFDHSINTAIKKLRLAIGDSAEKPVYIETVARRGYRLLVAVTWTDEGSGDPTPKPASQTQLESPPANQTGKRVSHYRVLEPLGGGGMGVVYAAEDLKLGRRVALKFLPHEVSQDPKALEQFEREARAASTLNNPNICTIHEFGEHQGQSFIAMELLDGQTLRDRILEEARFPVHRLLDIAIQIVSGLQAAHQKRIIHRDIKPANIFITKVGEVKILDFGLARTDAGLELVSCSAETHSTLCTNVTGTGVAIGTAAYMSPEQVRGEILDTRTDLFSFGLVLYEMATKQQAFNGETAPVLHAATLDCIPTPASSLNPDTPIQLERIINRALQKDRRQRYQTASEISLDLRALVLGLSQKTRKQHAEGKPKFAAMSLAATAGTLLIFFATLWFTKTLSHPARGTLEVKQRQLTTNSSDNAVSGGAISPDGRYLAYADLSGIHIKLIETGETRTVPQPETLKGAQVNWGIATNWVRDGSSFIATANVSGKAPSVWAVPATAGLPRKLRDDAYAWAVSRDGSRVAFNANPGRVFYREMWQMRPDGGLASKLYEGDNTSGFFGADWSPNGERLSYIGGHLNKGNLEWSIETRTAKGNPVIVPGTTEIADRTWSPDGRIIFIREEVGPLSGSCNFWGIPVDGRTGQTISPPARLTNWAGFCIQDSTVTADGKQLAFRKISPQGTIYVADVQGDGTRVGIPRRLTFTDGISYPFAWTPDSNAVVFESYRDGRWNIFKQSLDDDAAAQPIVNVTQSAPVTSATTTSDGTWLLYVLPGQSSDASTPGRLMRIPMKGGSAELVLTSRIYDKPACAQSPRNLCATAELTPDRKQLIFSSFDPGTGHELELTRFNTDPAPGVQYVWDLSPDGKRIAILKYSDGRIDVLSLNGQSSQSVVVKGWSNLLSLNWASDGNGILASSQVPRGSVLLRVSLKGEAHVLWQHDGSVAPWNRPYSDPSAAPFAVPSPNGRYLAIYGWNLSSNFWMMENF